MVGGLAVLFGFPRSEERVPRLEAPEQRKCKGNEIIDRLLLLGLVRHLHDFQHAVRYGRPGFGQYRLVIAGQAQFLTEILRCASREPLPVDAVFCKVLGALNAMRCGAEAVCNPGMPGIEGVIGLLHQGNAPIFAVTLVLPSNAQLRGASYPRN